MTKTLLAAAIALPLLTGTAGIIPAIAGEEVEDVRPSGTPIALGINLGTALHLQHGVSTVFVANEEIADVNMKDATTIFLYGKKGGSTVLYAEDNDHHIVLSKVVQVTPAPVTVFHGAGKGEESQPVNLVVPVTQLLQQQNNTVVNTPSPASTANIR